MFYEVMFQGSICLLIPFELIDTLINIPMSNIGLFTIEFVVLPAFV